MTVLTTEDKVRSRLAELLFKHEWVIYGTGLYYGSCRCGWEPAREMGEEHVDHIAREIIASGMVKVPDEVERRREADAHRGEVEANSGVPVKSKRFGM